MAQSELRKIRRSARGPALSCRWRVLCAVLCLAGGTLPARAGNDIETVAASEIRTAISVPEITTHITYLASPELRGRGEEGKVPARRYIVEHYRKLGLQPFFAGEWLQLVPGQKSLDGQSEGPAGYNIGAFVPGTDPRLKNEWIIVNAHYDHLGVQGGRIYPGADDNASGTAMVLELARHVAAQPLPRSVAFVNFDFEESLLWGSRWFIGHMPVPTEQVKFCLTADMISRSLGGLGLPTLFVLGAEHSSAASAAIDNAGVPEGLEIAQLGTDMVGTRSDYGPFRDERIPFLFLSTGEHPDYHSPRDTPERVDFPKATRVSNFALGVVRELGAAPTIAWREPQYRKVEEARAVNHITEQLVQARDRGDIELSATQLFFISQARSKTGYMLRVGRVSDTERKWLTRTAQLLLLSVF